MTTETKTYFCDRCEVEDEWCELEVPKGTPKPEFCPISGAKCEWRNGWLCELPEAKGCDAMRGYYKKTEIESIIEGLTGLTELVRRGDRWEHVYPTGRYPEIRILKREDFMFESFPFDHIEPGFEYTNLAGGRMKVIRVEDAPDYPMPKRW